MLIRSFPPLAAPDARVLILGSMPGVESLRQKQYYAHPRNVFWRVMGELLGFDPALPYEQRAHELQVRGVAVWDVLKCCVREGSLDSNIDHATEQANDLVRFLREHEHVRHVFFNGSKAEQAFRRHVGARIARAFPQLACTRLPSTSPAHAGRSYAEKLHAWGEIKHSLESFVVPAKAGTQ